MKPKIMALLGVIIVAGFGVGLASGTIFASPLLLAQAQETETSNGFGLMEHIILIATDPDGNVKQYVQTDNVITNIGENCIAELLFDVATTDATHACDGSTGITAGTHGSSTNGFTFIAIGTNAIAAANDDVLLGAEADKLEETAPIVTDSTGAGASDAQVVLSEAFTPGAGTYTESGLFDAAGVDTGNMLARQTFPGIGLGASDQLTVQWTITLGT